MAGGNKNRNDEFDDTDRAGMADFGDEANMTADELGYEDNEM